MEHEAFEQLVSAWLDEPQNAELAERLKAAEAAAPELARLRTQYVRLHSLLTAVSSPEPRVDWAAFKSHLVDRVRQACPAGKDTADIDEYLRQSSPNIEQRVDWPAFRRHLSRLVASEAAKRRTASRSARWRMTAAAGALAAAAGILLLIGLPDRSPAPSPGPGARPVAQMWIELPTAEASEPEPGGKVVLAKVLPDTETDLLRMMGMHEDEPPGEPQPENYFMLEPMDLTGVLASAQAYGSR